MFTNAFKQNVSYHPKCSSSNSRLAVFAENVIFFCTSFSDCGFDDPDSGLSPLTEGVAAVQSGVDDIWDILTDVQQTVNVLTQSSKCIIINQMFPILRCKLFSNYRKFLSVHVSQV